MTLRTRGFSFLLHTSLVLACASAASATAATGSFGWTVPAIAPMNSLVEGQQLTLRLALSGFAGDGPARDRVTDVYCLVNGQPRQATLTPNGYEVTFSTPPEQAQMSLAWRVRTAAGPQDGAPTPVAVLARVPLPREAKLNWIPVLQAGCSPQTACKALTGIAPSGVPATAQYLLRRTGPAGLAHAEVTVRQGERVLTALPWQGPTVAVPMGADLRICLEVPPCDVPADGLWLEDVQVEVIDAPATHRIISNQPTRLGLRANVKSIGWLKCHAIWFAVAAGLALLVFIVLGNTRPKAFAAAQSIKVASNERNLARASYRSLRSLPGGRTGFYRSARVRLGQSGDAIRGNGWALQLSPGDSGSVIFRSRVGLECRRSGKWVRLQSQEEVAPGIDYRYGEIYFRLS